jgi:hypothetical protein
VDPVPDPLLLRKSGSAGNRTQHLWIRSKKLWSLDMKLILGWICESQWCGDAWRSGGWEPPISTLALHGDEWLHALAALTSRKHRFESTGYEAGSAVESILTSWMTNWTQIIRSFSQEPSRYMASVMAHGRYIRQFWSAGMGNLWKRENIKRVGGWERGGLTKTNEQHPQPSVKSSVASAVL